MINKATEVANFLQLFTSKTEGIRRTDRILLQGE